MKGMVAQLPRTYNEMFISVRNALREMDVPQSSLEARLLLAGAAEKSMEDLMRDMPLYAGNATEDRVKEMLERRRQGEPLAYIIGMWEFYGLPIRVNSHVLIPRNDTEVVVKAALEAAKRLPEGSRALDLCCGSGCIGVALASNAPNLKITMTDISDEAVKIAKSNVLDNNLSGRVTCIKHDVLEEPKPFLGKFELVVSNPPYIPTGDLKSLDNSVIGFEPVSALDGGVDGLDFYRNIAMMWRQVVKPGGCMIFECGIGQSKQVEYLLRVNGFTDIETTADTGEIERAVIGWRPESDQS